MSVRDGGDAGYVCHIPKPVIQALAIKDKISFIRVGNRFEVSKP